MNTPPDIDRLLSEADPAARWSPSPAEQDRAIATALATAQSRRTRRRIRRPAFAAAIAGIVVLGVGGVSVASSFISAPAQEAFSSQRASAPDNQSHPLAEQATLQVTAKGPDGGTVSLWTAPLPDDANGSCVAIVGSVAGAPFGGKPFHEGAACSQNGTQAEPTGTFSNGQGELWVSPETGKSYWRFGGTTGAAAAVQLRIPGRPPKNLATGNGWYVGITPLKDFKKATLVAFDNSGQRLVSQAAWAEGS
ncbi:MAG: hypothetical protein WAS05_01790 [Candidatus Nanopelagicales bacterium]